MAGHGLRHVHLVRSPAGRRRRPCTVRLMQLGSSERRRTPPWMAAEVVPRRRRRPPCRFARGVRANHLHPGHPSTAFIGSARSASTNLINGLTAPPALPRRPNSHPEPCLKAVAGPNFALRNRIAKVWCSCHKPVELAPFSLTRRLLLGFGSFMDGLLNGVVDVPTSFKANRRDGRTAPDGGEQNEQIEKTRIEKTQIEKKQ